MNGQAVYLDIDKIQPNTFNPNVMDEETFEALKHFCRTFGAEQLDPIWVRRIGIDRFEIIDGEHRWKAGKAVGWRRIRAYIIDITEYDAKVFNVRKNRERGHIDAIKFGKILYEENERGITLEQLAKNYGYASKGHISEFINIYKNREKIFQKVPTSEHISQRKALQILRELKAEEQPPTEKPTEAEAPQPPTPPIPPSPETPSVEPTPTETPTQQSVETPQPEEQPSEPTPTETEEPQTEEPTSTPIDTGLVFECPCCDFKATIIHVNPNHHKFQKVHIA